MKVCMVVLNGIWHDPRVRRTATSAVKAGMETVVVGLKGEDYDENKIKELPFKTILVEIDKKYYRKEMSGFAKLVREIVVWRKIAEACKETNSDVIHANDLNALPAAYLAAKENKCKIVYDSHEIFTENEGSCRGRVGKFFWKTIERYLIKRVNQVICVSHSSAAELAKMYKIETPLVITNCAFKVDSKLLKAKSSNVFEVLYHGKFYKGRGYEAFIKAAALLNEYKDIQFVLRGLGIIEEELKNLAKENKLEKKVRFDPPVNVTELVIAASSSHVGVVIAEPKNKNFINTVSNKLFEYINAGLPVLLSDGPEHRYLNEKYNFGIILENNTPECIAEAVLKIYKDKGTYEKLCENVKLTASILNWENEFIKLSDIYKRLVSVRTP